MSLYLQRVLGIGPALTGVEFLPFALGVIAGSVLAVKLGYRLAPRTLLVGGGLLTATGFAWFGLISPGGSFAVDVLGPSIVASVGFGLCLGPVVSTATIGVAPHEAGTASGLLNSSRQIGASLGLAALGTAAAHRTGHRHHSPGPHRWVRARPDAQCRAPDRSRRHRPHRPASDQAGTTGRAGGNAGRSNPCRRPHVIADDGRADLGDTAPRKRRRPRVHRIRPAQNEVPCRSAI